MFTELPMGQGETPLGLGRRVPEEIRTPAKFCSSNQQVMCTHKHTHSTGHTGSHDNPRTLLCCPIPREMREVRKEHGIHPGEPHTAELPRWDLGFQLRATQRRRQGKAVKPSWCSHPRGEQGARPLCRRADPGLTAWIELLTN